MLRGQGLELAGRLPVELDEDQVPDLDQVRVVGVHQVRRVPPANSIDVDLRAWSCGSIGKESWGTLDPSRGRAYI